MEFTFKAYENLIDEIKRCGYRIGDYSDYSGRSAILRHDVDYDLEKAAEFSEFEKKLQISSVYMVLISSDFYNIHSSKNRMLLQKIASDGHGIGLHFDETQYIFENREQLKALVMMEKGILEKVLGIPVHSVSMHRPSKKFIQMNLEFDDFVNSYSDLFFRQFKYVSDSRRNWREDVISVIRSKEYEKLHILTHPFWYDHEERGARDIILGFLRSKGKQAYDQFGENFTNLEEYVKETDL